MQDSHQLPEDHPEGTPPPEAPGVELQGKQSGFGWGSVLLLTLFVVVAVALLLPAIQQPRIGATRSSQAELEARQAEIERAILDAEGERIKP